MKIICISDTHEKHNELNIPKGDILIHAGDVCFSHGTWTEIEKLKYLTKFNKWLETVPCDIKILIGGNHDFLFEQVPEVPRTILNNCHYLHDESITINGLKIYGSPYQPWFYNWAFNKRPHEITKIWENIPADTDILVTHGPPNAILDDNKGCPYLKEKILKLNQLKLHVFGHIHNGYGVTEIDNKIFVNASVVNNKYDAKNEPIVINI